MGKAKVHYISGGQRSGKTAFAEKTALTLSPTPIYLATSRAWDDEHANRIKKHQAGRSSEWVNIEEEVHLSKHDFNNKVVLLDCITLWLTNIFTDAKYDADDALNIAKKEWDKLIQQNCTLLVVSNEIGMGVIPDNTASRKFVDLQGYMNQYIAQTANQATFMVSGLPMKVK
jgi:adenosylcobinamide kinase/adenosylcobinamide-phosphate guanylyltransferase